MNLIFSPKANNVEKVLMFFSSLLFAPFLASAICFCVFTFLGIEPNEFFKYLVFGICELICIIVYLMIYIEISPS